MHKKNDSANNLFERAKDAGYWFTFVIAILFLGLFRKGFFYLLLFCVGLPLSSTHVEASIWNNNQQNAYQAYQDKDYKHAAELYENNFDKGAALYKKQKNTAMHSVRLLRLSKKILTMRMRFITRAIALPSWTS